MFGNNDGKGNLYTNPVETGSDWLQNVVVSKIYSGDKEIQKRLADAQLYWKFYNNKH